MTEAKPRASTRKPGAPPTLRTWHLACLMGAALLMAVAVEARAEPGHSAQGSGSQMSTESGSRGRSHGACERLKRGAVIHCYACLLTVGDSARLQARCADRFERRFSFADDLDPGCPPLADFDRTERAVRDQARAVLIGNVSAPPCQAIVQGANGLVTCQLHGAGLNLGTSVAALDDVLAQIHGEPTARPAAA
jgi:hypothetical protein